MTDTAFRVLTALRQSALLPYRLYPIISPNGRFNKDKDYGSSKGGPSRVEYAANNYMGKLEKKGWVRRTAHLDKTAPEHLRGMWWITVEGTKAFMKERRERT